MNRIKNTASLVVGILTLALLALAQPVKAQTLYMTCGFNGDRGSYADCEFYRCPWCNAVPNVTLYWGNGNSWSGPYYPGGANWYPVNYYATGQHSQFWVYYDHELTCNHEGDYFVCMGTHSYTYNSSVWDYSSTGGDFLVPGTIDVFFFDTENRTSALDHYTYLTSWASTYLDQ